MAEYNAINSTVANELVEGTEGNDSIKVYGNHSTVQALGGDDIISVNGGRHDNGIWLDGDETNLIDAGAGNDSIGVFSRGASVLGGAGNDTVDFNRAHTYANGGEGNDLFFFNRLDTNDALTDITIAGGAGSDTIEMRPYYTTYYSSPYSDDRAIKMLVTDFSGDDAIRIDENNPGDYDGTYSTYRTLTQEVVGGNVVISDNASISSYGGNTSNQTVDPKFSITLQGVSDISQVADAKYYVYYNDAPRAYTTFGEFFGVTSTSTTDTVQTATDTTTTSASGTTTSTTTTTAETTTTTTTTTTETSTTTTVTPTVGAATSQSDTATGGGTVVNNYYGDVYNVSGNSGTVVINSSVEGGVGNTVIINKEGDTYTYNAGDKVINNYQQGEVVRLDDYQGLDDISGNSFYIKSQSGRLEIQNMRDKFVGYSAFNSEVIAYSYVASGGGNVDGRGKSQAEILIGADHNNNQIFAGNGGSSVWGGNGGADTLVGGDGYDEFVFAQGSGGDVIQNAGSNDIVNLLGVTLDQIADVSVSMEQVHISFTNGEFLQVKGNSGVGYRLQDQTYVCNQSTGQWSTK
ncbi:MAG: hypothetical protein IJU91_10035 [Selenomonadaceae bacterium]|nr:hypothetical protein [Selenomonadaceae bacterium]